MHALKNLSTMAAEFADHLGDAIIGTRGGASWPNFGRYLAYAFHNFAANLLA